GKHQDSLRVLFTRFVITPSRTLSCDRHNPPRRNGFHSATAGLFGFRGFLTERLRKYDYQLGRRNCQRFLTEHFVLPEENPLVAEFHQDTERLPELALQRHLIHSQMCLYARVRSLLDLVSLRVLSAGRGPHVLRLLRCWNFWW